MHRLLWATRNAHKTREFAEILEPEWQVIDLSCVDDIPPVEETGSSFEENAILKAIAVSRVFPGWVVADDSGLEVSDLNGAPGVYSARYSGEGATDGENVRKLLDELANLEAPANRQARFRCALALARDGKSNRIFLGELAGQIAMQPRGDYGFGYDPVFVPVGYDKTLAELGEETKNRISHRAVAIKKLRKYLSQQQAQANADPSVPTSR